jgi:beta-N-acetylhexosaminidase
VQIGYCLSPLDLLDICCMIGALMLDIEGTVLNHEDRTLLQQPQVGGLILFSRNIENPAQVRALTNSIREIRPDILIAVDQEGGRVQRLRAGFSRLPPMRQFGRLYDQNPTQAITLAEKCGWLMAIEVLAVGIDFSFAPVLDLDGVSQVIGDRGFHQEKDKVISLAAAFMQGMHRAGMATTGKHFPGHGSVEADSHIAAPVDHRSFEEIERDDMQPFIQLKDQLDALMPAHVIYDHIDPNPAGFSPFWLQTIIRDKLNFDGVLFSDDLTMQAACVAGGADARILAALHAGCDMGLVCNSREAACTALAALDNIPLPNQARLEKMRGKIPQLQLSEHLVLDGEWQETKSLIAPLLAI